MRKLVMIKKEVYKGDEFTVTLNAKHVKQFVAGEFNVKFLEKNFKFANAKLNPAFEKLLFEKRGDRKSK